jgi:hypothetical protein
MYVVQNKDYAKYVIALALESEDDELKRCVERLKSLVDTIPEPSQKEKIAVVKVDEENRSTHRFNSSSSDSSASAMTYFA